MRLKRVWRHAGIKGLGKRNIPEKTRRSAAWVRHDSHMRKSVYAPIRFGTRTVVSSETSRPVAVHTDHRYPAEQRVDVRTDLMHVVSGTNRRALMTTRVRHNGYFRSRGRHVSRHTEVDMPVDIPKLTCQLTCRGRHVEVDMPRSTHRKTIEAELDTAPPSRVNMIRLRGKFERDGVALYFIDVIVWFDEATFKLSGTVNCHTTCGAKCQTEDLWVHSSLVEWRQVNAAATCCSRTLHRHITIYTYGRSWMKHVLGSRCADEEVLTAWNGLQDQVEHATVIRISSLYAIPTRQDQVQEETVSTIDSEQEHERPIRTISPGSSRSTWVAVVGRFLPPAHFSSRVYCSVVLACACALSSPSPPPTHQSTILANSCLRRDPQLLCRFGWLLTSKCLESRLGLSEYRAAPPEREGGETGDPRGNPPNSGTVWHESHLEKMSDVLRRNISRAEGKLTFCTLEIFKKLVDRDDVKEDSGRNRTQDHLEYKTIREWLERIPAERDCLLRIESNRQVETMSTITFHILCSGCDHRAVQIAPKP
ncbi:hypothetical protein PR048_028152 [Dryococelus australis]|uniref:Uncharacterized protein n=1 Tax=Dryococelus australis TaxID=614101 RepID=A0ABQ9GII0_9NEOP|nr:hypothetical protein PR048_028152 [Dryococelus australis]